jgi:hypothetical protein
MKSAEGLTNAKGAREAVKSFQDIRREAKEMLRGEQDDGITDESRMGEVIVVQETQCGK